MVSQERLLLTTDVETAHTHTEADDVRQEQSINEGHQN